MSMNKYALKSEEKAVLALRSIYDRYGYSLYKMSKFEEYDLYVRNKDFLVSDAVITFTDTNGKLLALKPDVTLSIIKNTALKKGQVQKLYYNENVYRVSQNTHSYKEIMQVGLECIGEIDEYCLFEVLFLAAKSLQSISKHAVLDISHTGILEALMAALELSGTNCAKVLEYISTKNSHELEKMLASLPGDTAIKAILVALCGLSGKVKAVLPQLEELLKNTCAWEAFCSLQRVLCAFEDSEVMKMLRIDFSVINDLKYYNGIIFKGYVEGIPASILSGGQYDKLVHKMKKDAGAVGFAVYLDLLERFESESGQYDVDTLIVYDAASQLETVKNTAQAYAASGTVLAQKVRSKHLKYKTLVEIRHDEVKVIEENA